MLFEVIRCPNCGGNLEIGTFNFIIGRGVCGYCNTAIQRRAGLEEAEKRCQKVYGLKKIGSTQRAREEARVFAESFPGDFRAWVMDYELNGDHNIGASYNPRPTAIERMCLTAEDEIDRCYLSEVGIALRKDENAIVARAADLDCEVKWAERNRTCAAKGNWRESVRSELDSLDRRIAEVEAGLATKGNFSHASYSDYASGLATICGILLTIAMIVDGCSKGDVHSSFQGLVLGPLGGLLFGAPFGAVFGVVAAAAVNSLRQKTAVTAKEKDERILSSLKQERQEKQAELGLAMDVGVIEDELSHLIWAKGQIEIALGRIAEVVA